MSRLVRIVAAAAVIATSLFTIDVATTAASAADPSAFVAQINSLRAGRGLAALAVNGGVASVAQGWAAHLAAVGALSHNPNLATQLPAGWRYVEENVGMGSNVAIIESSFAASPDHYGNIVNGQVTEVGVGVVAAGPYLWVVEDFWAGASAPAPSPGGRGSSGGAGGGSGGSTPPGRPGGSHSGGAPVAAGTGSAGGSGPLRLAPVPASVPKVLAPGPVATPPPAPSMTAPAGSGPVANLNTVANQVQYLDTFD